MDSIAKVLNHKTCSGVPANFSTSLERKLAPLGTAPIIRPEALVEAWKHAWALPEMDPSNLHWVGVSPHSNFNLGKARVAVVEQSLDQPFKDPLLGSLDILFPNKPTAQPTAETPAVKESYLNLEFGAFLSQDDGTLENALPIPMLAGGCEQLGQSILQAYPLNLQGAADKSVPTRRVKTFLEFMKEKDVWPLNYRHLLSFMPVYHLTAFMPIPTNPGDFNADYFFKVSGTRPLIVHTIIEDRLKPGYGYHDMKKSLGQGGGLGGLILPDYWDFPIRDMVLGENETEPRHSLFRAERAPLLGKVQRDLYDTVMGRFIVVVMQQPKPASPISGFLGKDSALLGGGGSGGSLTMGLTRGFEIGATSVGKGRVLEPVSVGDGASIDPTLMPTIFSIRVLGVRNKDAFSLGVLEDAGKMLPFSNAGILADCGIAEQKQPG